MGFVKRPTTLGFPVRHRLIIGYPEGCIWSLGLQDATKPCEEECIEGLLYGFQIKEAEGKGKTRFSIFIKDLETEDIDRITTGLQSEDGSYTWFSKNFCLSICHPDFDHTKPIILFPHKGKNPNASKAVFCSLFQDGKILRTEQDDDLDCLEVLQALAPNFPAVSLYPSDKRKKSSSLIEPGSSQNANSFDKVIARNDQSLNRAIDDYNKPDSSENIVSWDDLMARNNAALKRLNWDKEKGREYLLRTYGKRSRPLLSDEELIEFTKYLESLVDLLDTSVADEEPSF